MLVSFLILALSLFMVIRGATFSTTHAVELAENTNLSKYTIGFLVISVISILPETFIAISSALNGTSAFGLGVLLGSNVADLTLVVALVALIAKRDIAVEQRVLKNQAFYPFILLLPIVLGFDGAFDRVEGLSLIVAGSIFYYLILRSDTNETTHVLSKSRQYRSVFFLIIGLAVLLVGAHFTVLSASMLAEALGISPVVIGLIVVGLGTTMPEFFVSLNSVRERHDELAIGDILGTVLADATIVIGILALISPFHFPKTTIYIAGVFMVAAAFILFTFMRSGRKVTRMETLALFIFWVTFACVEFILTL